MRVILRADATVACGTGHVMRCYAIAEEFAERGAHVIWQATATVPWVKNMFARSGWSVIEPVGTPAEQARQALTASADLVVVDSYTLETDYQECLLKAGVPVVAVADDSQPNPGPASMWVNPGVPVPWAGQLGTHFLNGPEFVLIRREIRDLSALRRSALSSGNTRDEITILLGGTDFAGLSGAIDTLDVHSLTAEGIVAGPAAGGRRAGRVEWIPGGMALLRRAALSRLVVSAAGVSSWEMLHIGVPLGLILAAENQRGNYEWMVAQGLALGLGEARALARPDALAAAISDAWRAVREGTVGSSSVVDGLGAKRVVDVALALL